MYVASAGDAAGSDVFLIELAIWTTVSNVRVYCAYGSGSGCSDLVAGDGGGVLDEDCAGTCCE